MKRESSNLMKLTVTVFALAALTLSVAQADINKGKKYYLKSLKAKFDNMNGTRFAALHTQDEWEELFEENGKQFIIKYSSTYPKAAKFLQNPKNWKKLQHIRDFAIEYANDSGNVPSCG